MLDYLPDFLKGILSRYNFEEITEIRLRVNKPLSIQIKGKFILIECEKNFSCQDMESIIIRLTKHSVYAYAENIRKGYLVGEKGERIGLSGECVYDGEKLSTIKDFSSLCIRIPHEIIGCSDQLLTTCFQDGLKSVIVVSPPGGGKTTFLRDASRLISQKFKKNILVIDEKGELGGNGAFNLGNTSDVITNGSKSFAFGLAVTNMRPDVIITDELCSDSDVEGAKTAVLSGVCVLASAHSSSIEKLAEKPFFKEILNKKIFDYAVVLSSEERLGKIKEIRKL